MALQNEPRTLTREVADLDSARLAAAASAQAEEVKRIDAEAGANNMGAAIVLIVGEARALEAPIDLLEDEVKRNYPAQRTLKGKKVRAINVAAMLTGLQDRQRELLHKIDTLRKQQAAFEYEEQAAADQRDAALALAKSRNLDAQAAAALRDVALLTRRSVNPRFNRSKKPTEVLVEEIKVSSLPDAAADVKADVAFEATLIPGGVYEKFYDHNKVPFGRGDKDPNFIPMSVLEDMWREYATKNNLKKAIP